jgi:hypothetical protein
VKQKITMNHITYIATLEAKVTCSPKHRLTTNGLHSAVFLNITVYIYRCELRSCTVYPLLHRLASNVETTSTSESTAYLKLITPCGFSPRANYTDRATVACLRSNCQLLRIQTCRVVSAEDPLRPYTRFLDRSRYFFFQLAAQLYSRG